MQNEREVLLDKLKRVMDLGAQVKELSLEDLRYLWELYLYDHRKSIKKTELTGNADQKPSRTGNA